MFIDFQNVKHILDCPESNLPVLRTSRAAEFTEQIKMICPHMFPMMDTEAKIEKEKNESDE